MTELTIKLYSFHELSKNSQQKAIADHRLFLINTLQPDYFDGVTDWNDPRKMEMYYSEMDYLNENEDPIVESITINDYLFFANGEICRSCLYTAGPCAGTLEIWIHGEPYYIEGVTA